jgi:hypothetical protein
VASFPGALASFIGFVAGNTLKVDVHASQHNLEQAEILAVQTKVGTGSSTPASGTVLRGNGAGTSIWGQVALTTDVTGVLPIANGGNGTTSTTGSGSAVFGTSPTLSQPIVSDFTTAQHNHTNAAGGGALPLIARITTFTANGTYTPNANLLYCQIECVGGGGAGGGGAGTAGAAYSGAGGGGGGYSRVIKSAAQIGASQAITIGGGGTGVSGATGNNGSDTSVGALCIGKGGSGGAVGGSAALTPVPGAGGIVGTGDVTIVGNSGSVPAINGASITFVAIGGAGGAAYFGGGAAGANSVSGTVNGGTGTSGSGGGGAAAYNTASSATGGGGGNGLVVITEYCSQ